MTEADATISAPGLSLRFTGEKAARLRRHGSAEVVAGVRPQHLVLGGGGNGMLQFRATLSTSEQLGDQQLLDARVGDTPIRVAGVDPSLGLADETALSLGVLPDNVHLFDKATGNVLQ
jgi:ABC-type sugar transport system ATPase subunit